MENVEEKNPAAKCGNTPLHAAAKNGNLEVFKLIASLVSNINPKNDKNETPLQIAAKNNQFDILGIDFEYRSDSIKRKQLDGDLGPQKKPKF